MYRNAIGHFLPPYLRFADGDGVNGGGKEFVPPASQEDLDKLINGAVARTHKQYEGHDDLKAKAEKWEAYEAANADRQKPVVEAVALGDADVQKRIDEALSAERVRSGSKLVGIALDKALEGRTVEPSKLLGFERTAFVTPEGDVDTAKLNDWVNANTAESTIQRRRDPSQGARDARNDGGSVQSGRELYESRRGKKSTI